MSKNIALIIRVHCNPGTKIQFLRTICLLAATFSISGNSCFVNADLQSVCPHDRLAAAIVPRRREKPARHRLSPLGGDFGPYVPEPEICPEGPSRPIFGFSAHCLFSTIARLMEHVPSNFYISQNINES